MANRPSTRTVAEPLDACSYAIGAAVNCTNPGFSPVTMAHPLGLPSTVAIDASLGDHWNPAFVTGCVSPVAPTLNANAYTESRSPCPRMPRDCRESESRTTTWMSLALSVGTEQEASTTAHAAPSPRARTGKPMSESSVGNGASTYRPTGSVASAKLQPTPSLELQILVHHRFGRPRRGHVEHHHAGPPHVRQRLLARAQQLFRRRLAPGVARLLRPQRRQPVELRIAQRHR